MSDVARDDFKDNFQNLFEKEATEFASEILMPSGAILRLAGSKGFRTGAILLFCLTFPLKLCSGN